MADVVISADSLSKRYKINHEPRARYASLREATVDFARSLIRPRPSTATRSTEEFWALSDVNLDVRHGEALGVIGRNGAGKSTLLKILSRITEPTRGSVTLRGRVGSLLEVGTGFHPELTGRENIYLNGVILGMRRAEVRSKFDEIVAFAGVERFLDTPVKRYSSGMYVRLAFAVAAHLEPEILIVDEVLAVGDAEFQKKCLGKMNSVTHSGRTVIFVSHNMVAITSLCRRAIVLEAGRVAATGTAEQMASHYLASIRSASAEMRHWQDERTAPGPDFLKLRRVWLDWSGGSSESVIDMQSSIRIHLDYLVSTSSILSHITFHLINHQGIVVLTTATRPEMHEPGAYLATCVIPRDLLNSGAYSIRLLVIQNGNEQAFCMEDLISFTVIDSAARDHAFMGREPGVVQPPLQWNKMRVSR